MMSFFPQAKRQKTKDPGQMSVKDGGFYGLDYRPVLILLGLCLLPFLLGLFGADFSSTSYPLNIEEVATWGLSDAALKDEMFYAVQGELHHGLLEWSSVAVAVVTVLLSFTHYQINRDITVPIIGVALLCSGLMDAFHMLSAMRLIDAVAENAKLSPFTWALSRGFHAALMVVGIMTALYFSRNGQDQRREAGSTGLYIIGVISVIFITLSYVVVHVAATSVDLPQTQFPGAFITRPFDVIPFVMFIVMLPALWRLHEKVQSVFSAGMLLIVLPEIILEAHMAFGSSTLFDSHFNIAHFLKIIAYLVPFTGLLLDYIKTYADLNAEMVVRQQMQQELVVAKEKAEKATTMKSEFLANMSHEIRTPMNGVIGTTGLLLDTKLTEKQRYYAKTTMQSAEALLELINDILDFSKIEAGKLDLEKVPFDMQRLATEVAEVLAFKCREKNVEFLLHFPRNTVRYVIGDPGRVRQILLNLLSNAVKFTDEGHVLLTIKSEGTEDGQIAYSITVEDTGVGIEPEQINKIFNQFDQADTSTTREYGGTGLGLSISQNLSQLMGGGISVESTHGKGSAFTFTIVVEPDKTDAGRADLLPDIGLLKPLRVLAVDDSEISITIVKEQLEDYVDEVTTVTSAAEALVLLRSAVVAEKSYDIVLTDFCMPRMDGSMLAEQIRSDAMLKDVVLVLMTSAPKKGDGSAVLGRGFTGYLTKPIFPNEIPLVLAASYVEAKQNSSQKLVTRHSLKDNSERIHNSLSLQNTHILLTEDNAVNRMVAESILGQFGCFITPAGNGKEALELVMKREFDLIFMDCQMPEMDGFEASSRIRAHEEKYNLPRTPIVAFTANAMEGDRQRCLDAGMDDYMSKPVKQEVMETILLKWLSSKVKDESIEVPSSQIDQVAIETLKQLTDGQHLDIIESYLDFARGAIDDIIKAVENGDLKTVRDQAHGLKASSKQLGAMQLGDLAGELEMRSLSGELGDVELLIREFGDIGVSVLAEFETYLSEERAN